MSDADRETVRDTPETDLIKFHLGWGANIRHEFGLWHNPDLLASCGDEHPDDASMVIIHAVWESLQRGDHESDA